MSFCNLRTDWTENKPDSSFVGTLGLGTSMGDRTGFAMNCPSWLYQILTLRHGTLCDEKSDEVYDEIGDRRFSPRFGDTSMARLISQPGPPAESHVTLSLNTANCHGLEADFMMPWAVPVFSEFLASRRWASESVVSTRQGRGIPTFLGRFSN